MWEHQGQLCLNPSMVLYQIVSVVDACHIYVYGQTWDIKAILWMDDNVMTMTIKSLATRSIKRKSLDMT